jgi:ABC-2 type transport system ATP-binding protein
MIRLVAVAASTLCVASLTPASAAAKSCPNSSTSTVTGSPSYTYTRGCILSFDGTPIVYNLFEPMHPAPRSLYTIVQGPGWGGAGATTPNDGSSLSPVDPIANHYAELTWDPRGFGESGGVAEVDSPSAEGRDVSALISQVLTGRPEIAIDTCGKDGQPHYSNDSRHHNSCGEPVVGMASNSYGGGIQWATASFDERVKAIVPGWSWNDLDYSLFPGDVVKLGWDQLLFGAGVAATTGSHVQGDGSGPFTDGDGGKAAGGYDPMLYYAEAEATALGYPDQTTIAWLHQRSMAEYGAGAAGHVPDIPTLIIQGTVDTLFNLTDGWSNYIEVKAHHQNLPVKMIAFCGGHVTCPTGAAPSGDNYKDTASKSSPVAPGEPEATYIENETIAWFNHYLRGEKQAGASGDPTAEDGPDGFPKDAQAVYQDQNGNFYALKTFPTPTDPGAAKYVSAPVSGTLISHGVPTGVSPAAAAGYDIAITDGATNSSDPGQVTVPILTAPAKSNVPIVGIEHVRATVTVDGNATELFFRLIDKNTGDVVDLQTSPLRVDNLGLIDNGTSAHAPAPQKISMDLAGIAYDLPAGDTLELQVSTSTDSFAPNRGSAVVTLASGTVSVPTFSPEG